MDLLHCLLTLAFFTINKPIDNFSIFGETKAVFFQSVGTVQHTDCISAEVQEIPNECPRYNAKHLMVWLQQCCSFRLGVVFFY